MPGIRLASGGLGNEGRRNHLICQVLITTLNQWVSVRKTKLQLVQERRNPSFVFLALTHRNVHYLLRCEMK